MVVWFSDGCVCADRLSESGGALWLEPVHELSVVVVALAPGPFESPAHLSGVPRALCGISRLLHPLAWYDGRSAGVVVGVFYDAVSGSRLACECDSHFPIYRVVLAI